MCGLALPYCRLCRSGVMAATHDLKSCVLWTYRFESGLRHQSLLVAKKNQLWHSLKFVFVGSKEKPKWPRGRYILEELCWVLLQEFLFVCIGLC